MLPKERRAFALGYRFALRKARRELNELARHLDDEIAGLADEMEGMRTEYYRLKAVEEAIDTECDPDTLLN